MPTLLKIFGFLFLLLYFQELEKAILIAIIDFEFID